MTMTAAPSPELFFQTLWGYQRTAALKSAVELDVFTAIQEGNTTADAIGRRTGASARGTRILCDYLVMLGFLTKDRDTYALTQDSAIFLTKTSPAYMGGTLTFLLSGPIVSNHQVLTTAIREGGVPAGANDTVSVENPVWEEFARAMLPMMAMPAQAIAEIVSADAAPTRVLDIAAGHGIFGIAVAQKNPQARVVAVDWPKVLTVATENAQRMGVADRHSTVPGDAFTVDWGTGYDLALVTNFLHHFDIPTCTGFLRRVRAALAPGGRVAILEFVPNDDRTSPPLPAAFALTMLAGTKGGDAYTLAELTTMLHDAGFGGVTRHDLEGPQTVVVGTAK